MNVLNLTPDYVNGYCQAQGLFDIIFKFTAKNKMIEIIFVFAIYKGSGCEEDLANLATFFQQDTTFVQPRGKNKELVYESQNRDHLRDVVCAHFDQHSLKFRKHQNFLLFKKALNLTEKRSLLITEKEGKHLTKVEMRKIIDIAYAIYNHPDSNSYHNNKCRTQPKDYWLKRVDSIYP